ncbi:MAG: tetratricopeptide repeat protein [Moorea sp. SIO1F2]|uniref:tetratricopeptide repeat protein n=1 Tax=Moorena sp. SIO1F2 TaxID=2607819 RepID=UPI0013B6150B|nr:tetratricopeptide repeat protein [Moorena sp. SIO1F2]NET82816.1 tetratricopeptide repeat protein [Moorena sp. SIO1F2]
MDKTSDKSHVSLRWLHLTDLHLGMKGLEDLWPNIEEIFFEDLKYLCEKVGPLDLVMFTGDITQGGSKPEFQEVDKLLTNFWEKFRDLGFQPKFLAVPGNHDLVRPDNKFDTALIGLEDYWDNPKIEKPFWDNIESPQRQLVIKAFENYVQWWENTTVPKPDISKGILPGDFSATIEKDGFRLGILGLNSAFLQLMGGDRKGKLALDMRQFHAACNKNGPSWAKNHHACLLLTHHPQDWLTDQAQEQLNSEIHSPPERFALHLFGHMHEANLRSLAEGGANARRRLQGCSLFGMEGWGEENKERVHGYSLCELKIEGNTASLSIYPRKAEKKQGGGWQIDRDTSFRLPKGKDDTEPVTVTLLDNFKALETEKKNRSPTPKTLTTDASSDASSPPPSRIPKYGAEKFTGRQEELRQLEEVLLSEQDHEDRIVVLTGTGGMGKSTLAYHFATIHKDKFPDGVVTVRVDDKDRNKDLDTIAREFASKIEQTIDPEDDREPWEIMETLFAPRDMLLIFDNAEEASIKKLRPGGNSCAVIVTTRNQTLPSSLDVSEAQTIRLGSLPEKDALDLLRKILGESKINRELAAAQRITKIVGRLPLALRVVGAALQGQRDSLDDYAQALEEEKDELLEELKIEGDKDLNVEISLNFSLKSLSEDQIDCFACLSVCAAEGFAKTTAMVTAGLQNNLKDKRKLKRINELSLLDYVDTGENRYVLHPLVRVYAKKLADDRNLLATAQERHAKFFVEWLQPENLEDETVVDETVVDEAAANLDDVILAAEWLQTHEAETEQIKWENYQFALQLHRLFEKHGYWNKAIALTARFQSWAEQFQDWNAVVKYKMHQARNWSFAEEFEKAEEILSSAQSDLPNIPDLDTRKMREAKVLNVLAGVYQKQGKLEAAIQAFKKRIDIDEEIGNDRSIAITLNRLGGVLQEQGKLEEAQQAFEEVIKIAEAINDQDQLAHGLISLGKFHLQQGNIEKVQEGWKRAILIIKDSGELRRAAARTMSLGGELHKQRYLSEALQIFLLAADLHESFNSDGLVSTLRYLANGLSKKSFEEALKAIDAAIKICLNTDNKKNHKELATLYNIRGKIRQAQGRKAQGEAKDNLLKEAQQAFKQQIKIAKDTNDKKQLGIGLQFLFKNKFEQHKEKEAFKILNEAIYLSDDRNHKDYAIMLFNLANFLKEYKKFSESLEFFILLEDSHEHLESNKLIYSIRYLANNLYTQKNDQEALQATRLAINISIKTSNHKQLEEVLNILISKKHYKKNDIHEILSDSFYLAKELGNQLGEAIIANSLGQLEAHQEGEENFKLSQMYFRHSIKLFEELNEQKYLAKVHTARGQAFLARGDFDKAVEALSKGFEIDESLSNLPGLKIVTPNLIDALSRLGKREEALAYCDRALKIAPNYLGFLQLRDTIQKPISKGIHKTLIKIGRIRYIWYNEDNSRSGRIAPDDGSSDITFNEKYIGSDSASQLTQGALVEVEVNEKYGKLYAKQVRVIEE